MATVYVSIGNSDDKLTQRDWASFVSDVAQAVHHHSTRIYGQWHSQPVSPFQNAIIGFEISTEAVGPLWERLNELRHRYTQDSIAWSVACTSFIREGSPPPLSP